MFLGVAVTVRRESVCTKQLALSKTTKVFTTKTKIKTKEWSELLGLGQKQG